MRRMYLLLGVALAAAVFVIGAAACGDDNGDSDGGNGDSGGSSVVNLDLFEYQIVPDLDAVAAGSVTFNASNIGGAAHELVIVRTDVAPDALPVGEDGAVDESGEGIAVIDRIDEFAAQSDASVTVDLEVGSYVLICNIVEDAGTSHYEEGMRRAFSINE